MSFCTNCGVPLREDAAFCSNCGSAAQFSASQPAQPASAVAQEPLGRASALPENVAGALAYVTIIPAVIFLLLEPYRRQRFVRFHAFQCLFGWAAGVAITIALSLLGAVVALIPFVRIFVPLVGGLLTIAALILWLLLMTKAYQGYMFKLPILGDYAAQYAE